MDLSMYLFAGALVGMLLIAGLILLFVWNRMKKRQDYRKMRCIERLVLESGQRAFVSTISECMDILPDKIHEAKSIIDEREGY